MLSKYELGELSKVDIRKLNTENLKELEEIYIDPNATIEDRIKNFFNKVENPYCFKVLGTPVQISYANHNKTLEDCIINYLSDKKNPKN